MGSAPSRKTLNAWKSSAGDGQSVHKTAGREARPATPEAGRAPQLLEMVGMWVGLRCCAASDDQQVVPTDHWGSSRPRRRGPFPA
jgi:hypothetical protein